MAALGSSLLCTGCGRLESMGTQRVGHDQETDIFIFSCSEWGYPSVRCPGFSLQWLLLLQSTGSRAWAEQWGARAQLLLGTWDLPGSGIKPVSPALAGEFFTTEPAGKP